MKHRDFRRKNAVLTRRYVEASEIRISPTTTVVECGRYLMEILRMAGG